MFGRVGRGCCISSFGSKASSPQRTSHDRRRGSSIASFRNPMAQLVSDWLRLREITTWRLGRPRHEASTHASVRAAHAVLRKGARE